MQIPQLFAPLQDYVTTPGGMATHLDRDLYVCDNQERPDKPELKFKGRILRQRNREDKLLKWSGVATGMEHPNGMRIREGFVYGTQSALTKVKDPSGLFVRFVCRFGLDEKGGLTRLDLGLELPQSLDDLEHFLEGIDT